jgi:hypothetical protein
MNNRRFPVYAEHTDVACFSCEQPTDHWHVSTTGAQAGQGEHAQWCGMCATFTRYDIALDIKLHKIRRALDNRIKWERLR